jgi:hypothetical protein
MDQVGELVRQAADLVNSGSADAAYPPAATAVAATAARSGESLNGFVRRNWELISFMGLPNALPIPLSLPFSIKKVIPWFGVHSGAEEIVRLVLSETLRNGSLLPAVTVGTRGVFEVSEGRLRLPVGLLNGILGSVIFDPANRNETIEGDYWIAIADFKMFISELWGRRDLAERIIRFYGR